MTFQRTKNEVCPSLKGGAANFYENEILSVFYETTPEAVADVLPPGLKPYKHPIVMAGINNFIASDFDVPYYEVVLNVAAVHEKTGFHGFFVAGMALNSDMGLILGRELCGYPKKLGKITYSHDGNNVEGSAERHGIQYYTVKAEMGSQPNDPRMLQMIGEVLTPPDPEKHPGSNAFFNYVWPGYIWVHAQDVGKVSPPILLTTWKNKVPCERKAEYGTGQVTFRDSRHDPWSSLPVANMLGACMTYDIAVLGVNWTPDDEYPVDANAYMPHAYRSFDAKLD